MDLRLFWLALGTFAVGTGAFVIASLLPALSADLGVAVSQGGMLVLAFAVAYAFGTPILSALTGGFTRRPVLVSAMAVYGLANVASGLAPSYEVLMATRVVMAVASGLYAATAQGTAVLLSTPQTRTRAIAVIVGGTTLSVALGAPIGALIANVMDWRAALIAIGLVSFAVALALQVMLPADLAGTKLSLRSRLLVVTRPGIGRALLVSVFILAGAFAVYTYVAVLAGEIGMGQTLVPLVLLAFGVGAFVGNYLCGILADKFGAARTVGWVIVVTTVIMLAFPLEAYLLPASVAGWALIATMALWGAVGWGFPPAQGSYIVSLAPEAAPLTLALNASAIYMGVALGSGLGGAYLTIGSVKDLGVIAAILGVVSLAIHLTGRARPAVAPA